MKLIIKSIFLVILLIGAIQFSGYSQVNDPVIRANQIKQERRIKHGIRTGELTRREAHALRLEQKRVKLRRRAAKADDRISRAERKALRRQQKLADVHIYRQKHDGQSRY